MAKSETANLTVATELTKLVKIVLIFELGGNYPLVAPLLERQYEKDMRAECFLECRFMDHSDTSTIYKTSTGDIKHYTISPDFFQDELLA